eukprot:GILI01006712.1.p1 GENE.GILI01006712.1~~GILI01006712.1.p1  ORF type:complete len:552 (+),score=128.49 GILI01006712.1:38-1657(+)
MTTISSLSEDILFHCFGFLHSVNVLMVVPSISKEFRELVRCRLKHLNAKRKEAELVLESDLHIDKKEVRDRILKGFVNYLSSIENLESLIVEDYDLDAGEANLSILDRNQNTLRSLSLRNIQITNLSIALPVLESLTLYHCAPLNKFSLACPCLVSLTLKQMPLSDLDLQNILSNAPSLQHLSIEACGNIRTLGESAEEEATDKMAWELPCLKSLSLVQGQFRTRATVRMLERCLNLEKLEISKFRQLNRIPIYLPKLVHLDFSRANGVPLLQCPDLQYLNLSGTSMNDEQLDSTLSSCPSLRRLILREAYQVTPAFVFPALPHLTVLDVSKSAIGDEALRRLGTTSPHLESLNIEWCDSLGTPTVLLPCLRFLNACYTTADDNFFQSVFVNSPLLESLIADHAFLETLGFSSVHLRVLDVGSTRISDEQINPLVANCPNLQILRADGCNSLENIHFTSPSLRSVSMSRCTSMRQCILQCPLLLQLNLLGCNVLVTLETSECKLLDQVNLRFTHALSLSDKPVTLKKPSPFMQKLLNMQ